MPASAHISLLPLAIGLVVIGGVLLAVHQRKYRRRKRSKSVTGIGWMLLFLTSGRMPPPPPESQIEQDLKARNNRSGKVGEDQDDP